jgi:ribonucleotide monophosphatase NagD (HAD superfamily)
MDTDVIAGIESGMRTILVLTGDSKADDSPSRPASPPGRERRVGDPASPRAGLQGWFAALPSGVGV